MSTEDNEVIFGHRAKRTGFKHAMIDIETMSSHPSNALILSCALVPFDPEHRERLTLGSTYHWRFETVPQLIAGRQVDRSTQEFWSDQPLEAQLRLLAGKLVTLNEFHEQLKDALDGIEHVWARGIVFDIGNLSALFLNEGLALPWKYNAPDDVRTITRHAPKTRIGGIDSHGFVADIIPHDPVSDCIKQAHDVWEHWGSDAPRVHEPIPHHSV